MNMRERSREQEVPVATSDAQQEKRVSPRKKRKATKPREVAGTSRDERYLTPGERPRHTLSHLEELLGPHLVAGLGASSGVGLNVVRETVERGLPSEAVAELQKELAELRVPRPSEYVEVIASRAARARRQTLTPEQGERFVRIAGVLARALDVWGDEEDAADFLVSPHPLLGGDTPIDRARSELGARQVEDILAKLDLGLPV